MSGCYRSVSGSNHSVNLRFDPSACSDCTALCHCDYTPCCVQSLTWMEHQICWWYRTFPGNWFGQALAARKIWRQWALNAFTIYPKLDRTCKITCTWDLATKQRLRIMSASHARITDRSTPKSNGQRYRRTPLSYLCDLLSTWSDDPCWNGHFAVTMSLLAWSVTQSSFSSSMWVRDFKEQDGASTSNSTFLLYSRYGFESIWFHFLFVQSQSIVAGTKKSSKFSLNAPYARGDLWYLGIRYFCFQHFSWESSFNVTHAFMVRFFCARVTRVLQSLFCTRPEQRFLTTK